MTSNQLKLQTIYFGDNLTEVSSLLMAEQFNIMMMRYNIGDLSRG